MRNRSARDSSALSAYPPLVEWADDAAPAQLINSATFHFARAAAYNMMNVYAIKMAGVFMITTSTLAIYTGFAPRWLAILGYAFALLLLFGSYYLSWSFIVFPLWVLVMSIHILIVQVRGPHSDASSVQRGTQCN
jgi:hypothetical protein